MELVPNRPQNYRPANTSSRAKRRRVGVSKVSAPASAGLKRYLGTRGTPSGVYEIVRTVSGNVALLAAGFTNGAVQTNGLTFTFSPQNLYVYDSGGGIFLTHAIPNAAEMSALWSDVKLDKVEITFSGLGAPTPATTNGQIPNAFVCTDDSNVKTSTLAIVQQQGDCQPWFPSVNGPYAVKKLTLKPKFQQLIQYSAVANGYMPQRGYIRSDYDVEHFSAKLAIEDSRDGAGSDLLGRLNYSVKFYFKYKNLK